jgi:hypothetical protein
VHPPKAEGGDRESQGEPSTGALVGNAS